MTSLVGVLLRASSAELGDLATRWGADSASPTIASMYSRIADESFLSHFLEDLSADQRQLLSLVCRQRRGEASPDSLAASMSCPDAPLLVESLLKAALLHRSRAGLVGVPSDLLPMLRRLLLGTTSGASRPKTVHLQSIPRDLPALKRAAVPASIRTASDGFLEHLPSAYGRRATGRRKNNLPSRPEPSQPSAASPSPSEQAEAGSWPRAGRLASECAGGLGLLSEREGRSQADSESIRRWGDLDGHQRAAAALEVWLSRRTPSWGWPSGVAPFRTRQLLWHCLAAAGEGEWYSSLSLLERARRHGLSHALRKASIRLARCAEADRTEVVLTDLHLFGCLDLGLDSARRMVAFRVTPLGAILLSRHLRKPFPSGASVESKSSTSGVADA